MLYNPPYGVSNPDAPYVNGDPSIAQQGSILPAEAAEFPQREIVSVIANSNYIPTNNDLQQLTRAVRSQFLNFCVDNGAANALSVALTPPLTQYRQGFPLRVLVANDNTGPATINVNSLGNRQIKRASGGQLQPGDMKAGMIASLVDDGTAYQLQNYLGATGGGINNTYITKIPYAEDTSIVPNQVIASFTPAITTVNPGDVVIVKVKNLNTGAMTLAINALAPVPINRNDGQPLQAGDIGALEGVMMEFNTTYWQMLRLVKSQTFFKLTTNLIVYVRPDGNDANSGVSNDPAHALQTIDAAVTNIQANFLLGGRTATIQLGIPGTYNRPGAPSPPTTDRGIKIMSLAGAISIVGDKTNKANYIVKGPKKGPVISVSGSGVDVTMQGWTANIVDTTNNMIVVSNNASIHLMDMSGTGPTCFGSFVAAFEGGDCTMANTIDLFNSSGGLFGAGGGSKLTIGIWKTLITVHGITVNAFVNVTGSSSAYIAAGYCSFSGAAYGYRYLASSGGQIQVNGGGPYYLPGSIDGKTDYPLSGSSYQ